MRTRALPVGATILNFRPATKHGKERRLASACSADQHAKPGRGYLGERGGLFIAGTLLFAAPFGVGWQRPECAGFVKFGMPIHGDLVTLTLRTDSLVDELPNLFANFSQALQLVCVTSIFHPPL